MAQNLSEQLNRKIIILLLIGSASAFLGAAIAGQAKISLGTSQTEFIIMLFISFIFFMVTGISWLYTAVFIKDKEEC